MRANFNVNNPKDLADLLANVRETIINKIGELIVANGKRIAEYELNEDESYWISEFDIDDTTYATYVSHIRVNNIRCVTKRVNGVWKHTLFMNGNTCPNDLMRCASIEELWNVYSNMHYQITMAEKKRAKELEKIAALVFLFE